MVLIYDVPDLVKSLKIFKITLKIVSYTFTGKLREKDGLLHDVRYIECIYTLIVVFFIVKPTYLIIHLIRCGIHIYKILLISLVRIYL